MISRLFAGLFLMAAVFAHATEPSLHLPGESVISSARHWLLLRQLEQDVLSENRWGQLETAEELLLRTGDPDWVRFSAYALGVDDAAETSPFPLETRVAFAVHAADSLERHQLQLPQPWACAQLQAFILVARASPANMETLATPQFRAQRPLLDWMSCGGGPHQPAHVADSYRKYIALPEEQQRGYLLQRLDYFRPNDFD